MQLQLWNKKKDNKTELKIPERFLLLLNYHFITPTPSQPQKKGHKSASWTVS